MTYHRTRKTPAKGTAVSNKHGHKLSPRVAVSLPADDMRRLAWWSQKTGKPVAALLRNAVWAYLLPIAADADREAGEGGANG